MSLLLIGLTIFFGTLSGKAFQKIKVPQVTGYIIIGLILGQTGLKLWTPQAVESMTPIVNLALGMIGFMIGAELKLASFRNRGRAIYSILLAEGLMTFMVVCGAVYLLTGKLVLGILFGALASATAPAATVDVLWEYKTRGPLTSTLLAVVALDDVLALLLYAFASFFARALIVHESLSLGAVLLHIVMELGIVLAIGVVCGMVLYWLTHFIRDRERVLPFSFGVIALGVGVATFFKVDLILAMMVAGMTLSNIALQESEDIFAAIKKVSPPIYILFFVLVGARLDIARVLGAGMALLVIVYILARTAGKVSGAFLGGVLGRAAPSVTRYLGVCLFSQAGVAIGMAISISHTLGHYGPEAQSIGLTIINVIVATTFIVQLIGPPAIRFAVDRAGEMWKDITEEDIVGSYRVKDLIDPEVTVIPENLPLSGIVQRIKNSDSYHFCVVDPSNHLLGTINLGDLRTVLLEQEGDLQSLVLARDIAVPTNLAIVEDEPLKAAIDIFRRRELDFLPVIKDSRSRELAGAIHYRQMQARISRELLTRRGV